MCIVLPARDAVSVPAALVSGVYNTGNQNSSHVETTSDRKIGRNLTPTKTNTRDLSVCLFIPLLRQPLH